MLNDSTTGTEVLNIANSGAATFSSNIVFGDGHFIGDDADDNLWIAGGSNENIIIDSATDIFLDAASENINLRVSGSLFGRFQRTSSAYLSVQSNGGNLRLGANNTDYWSIDEYRLYPVTDNVDDIGLANNRVKDLYLSGGVFLGGTGAANKLEDYEEGTFTPSYTGSSGNPTINYNTQVAIYTKIGNTVRVDCFISGADVTGLSGAVRLAGLPFGASGYTPITLTYCNLFNFDESEGIGGFVESGNTYVNLVYGSSKLLIQHVSADATSGTMMFTVFYKTNA